MCIGVPYEILEPGFLSARARSRREEAEIDMRLVGDQPAGTHVLVFLGAAREILSPEEARQIADALEALEQVMAGATDVDCYFADLVEHRSRLADDAPLALEDLERTPS